MFRIIELKRKNYFCPVCQKGLRKAKVVPRFQPVSQEETLLGCPKCGNEVTEMTEYIHRQLARLGRTKEK